LRQAVIAAADLDAVTGELREKLDLDEPYNDPGVAAFGLHNAVFAVGDTFLEVVSPIRGGTAAGRWLSRRGGDAGYMVMFQVADLDGARNRIKRADVREVFEIELDDISEVHLHPADMRGAIVAVSEPDPPSSWRWGGPSWSDRSAGGHLAGAEIRVRDADAARARWAEVLGGDPEEAGVVLRDDPEEPGLVRIDVSGRQGDPVEVGGVEIQFVG
jgi:Glyoxalase-like domain